MVSKLEAVQELARRGRLPDEYRPLYDEAVKRGLVEDARSETSTFLDVGNQFGERFNRGAYLGANAPTSLANLALGGVDRAAEAFGGNVDFRFKRPLEAAAPGMDQAIMDVPEARTSVGKVAGSIGEAMGANALPGLGMVAAAPRVAQMTMGAQGTGGRIVNNMATGITNSPGKALAGEALASAGSGVGGQIARDTFPGNPTAEFIGSMAGGFAAPGALAVSPARLAAKGAGSLMRRASPKAMQTQARQQLSSELSRHMTPEGLENIRLTERIRQAAPDYQPSVAEATENPSLIATQRAFEGELSGPDLDKSLTRYSANESAIRRGATEQAPQFRGDAGGAVAGAARGRLGSTSSRLDRALESVTGRQQNLADGLRSGRQPSDLGATLRENLSSERANVREQVRAIADDLGLNSRAATIPFGRMRDPLLSTLEPQSRAFTDPALIPQDLRRTLETAPDRVSMSDLIELRSRIGDEIADARRSPDHRKRGAYLERLQETFDTQVEGALRQSSNSGLADNYREFRRLYRSAFIEPYEQGASRRVLATDSTRGYRVQDEQVASQFFDAWDESSASQFQRAFRGNAEANAALEAAALDSLHNAAVRNGALDPAALHTWRRKHASVLESFPRLRDRIDNVEGMATALASRRSTLANRRKQIEQSYLARELAAVDRATRTPEEMIARATENPQRMRTVLRAVKTPEAKTALQRALWDQALSSADPLSYLQKNANTLRQALGGKYQTALLLARRIQKNRLVPRPSGQPIDTNPVAGVEALLGTGLNQVSSRIFAVKSGRTSARYAMSDIAGRAFRNMTCRQAREMLREALYDPQVARDLSNYLMLGPSAIKRPQANRLGSFAIANGIVAFEEGDRE